MINYIPIYPTDELLIQIISISMYVISRKYGSEVPFWRRIFFIIIFTREN